MREAAHYDPTTVLLGLKIPLPILLRADWPNGRRSDAMKPKHVVYLGMVAIAIALVWAGSVVTLGAQQAGSGAVAIDADDIGGVVTSANGPEAGVWVIAETTDLPTKFAKLVVTDDRGRFLIPDLPKANYSVWVRGYGLVDSPKVSSTPGKTLNLTAVPAPSAAAAAEYYPAAEIGRAHV